MTVNMAGPDMRLACPATNLNTTDFAWQLASRLRYTCWDAKSKRSAWLLDYLVSPANGLDKIDTTSIARGDGSSGPAGQGKPKAWKASSAVIAGAVIGAVAGVAVLGVLAWVLVGRKALAMHKVTSFTKFVDEPASTAATAASSGGASAAGISDQTAGAKPANRDAKSSETM